MGFLLIMSPQTAFVSSPRLDLLSVRSFRLIVENFNLQMEGPDAVGGRFHLHSKYRQACSPSMESTSLAECVGERS